MAPSVRSDCIVSLCEALRSRQMESGGWAYFDSAQESLEATCMAALALMGESRPSTEHSIRFLLATQRKDGGWPAFAGDSEPSWVTALALCTLNLVSTAAVEKERAVQWLLRTRGREGHWFWRWKFKTADREVQFDSDKFGWPWLPGANSWVIPTGFSLVALKQYAASHASRLVQQRIDTGVQMLLDRACSGGGWNAGNSIAYGKSLPAHIEPTSIGLLGLQGEARGTMVQHALDWLKSHVQDLEAISSLAWAILALFVYQELVGALQDRLSMIISRAATIRNTATMAAAVLALKCRAALHPFAVLS